MTVKELMDEFTAMGDAILDMEVMFGMRSFPYPVYFGGIAICDMNAKEILPGDRTVKPEEKHVIVLR